MRFALDQGHHELVRVELAHRRALDERHALEAVAHVGGVEQGERNLRRDAGGGEDLGLGQASDAGDRHLVEAEAEKAGQGMARLAVALPERVDMAADDRSGDGDDAEEDDGQAEAEETGELAVQPGEPASRGRRASACAAGQAGAQRSQEASSTIHLTSSPNE